jgi:WD40 repeat protein
MQSPTLFLLPAALALFTTSVAVAASAPAIAATAATLPELSVMYVISEPAKNNLLPYELFYTSEEDKKIVRYDNQAKIIWEYPAEISRDLRLLSNGNILFCYNNNYDARKSKNPSGVLEITPDKRIVFEYQTTGQVFSCDRLPNGDTAISASSLGKVLIVDGKGNLKKEILTPSKPGHSSLRQVRGSKNGDILLAEELAKVIRRYNSEGKIVGEIPMPYTPFGLIEKENGNIIISGRSGVREVAPDGKVVWDFAAKNNPQLGIRWCTGIELLPNGNVLVANSGGKVRLFELKISSEKPEIVWQVDPEKLKLSLGHGIATVASGTRKR